MPIIHNTSCPALTGNSITLSTTRCDGSGDGDIETTLNWKMGQADEPDYWTEGPNEEWKLFFDKAANGYVLQGLDMAPTNFGPHRCAPSFKATALGVEINTELYDITVEGAGPPD